MNIIIMIIIIVKPVKLRQVKVEVPIRHAFNG